jgi:Phage integrase, N-terminal SAM-like domain
VLVTRVVSPVSSRESWTVVGDDDRTVEPVELYLAYLTGVERSPNTVKAYAHDLKDWFEFLTDRELDWRSVILEDIGAFVVWLRRPVRARDGRVAVLPSVAPANDSPGINGWGRKKARADLETTACKAVGIADVVCFDSQSQRVSEFSKVGQWVWHSRQLIYRRAAPTGRQTG